jgi:purine-binding chemotaxis protein CheW
MVLKNMDEPHQRIHATAAEALGHSEQGDQERALGLLNDRRNHELAALVKLFEEARQLIHQHNRELAVVLGRAEKRSAISIDRIESVERILEENIEPLSAALTAGGNTSWRIGKRTKTQQTILLLKEDELVFE